MEDQPKDEINNEEQPIEEHNEEHPIEDNKEEQPIEENNEEQPTEENKEEKNDENNIEENNIDKEKEEKERKEKDEKERKEKEEKDRKEREEQYKKNFEKLLWNKYDFLHKRYKTKLECFENALEIFNKISGSLKDQQKVINTIISKKYTLFPGADYTQSIAINMIKKELDDKYNQLTSTLNLFKKTLIDQFKRHKDEAKATEKDNYNHFLKIMSKYNDSKVLLEKNKNKYYQSVKVAELSLKNSKTMKVKNIDNSKESLNTIQKMEDKAKELLDEAKKNYEKYTTSLKDANNNREESIDRQIKLINLYKTFEEKDGEILNNMLKELYNRQKEEHEAQANILKDMDTAIKNIDIIKDNVTLINSYNSTEKPDEVIPLEQYQPQIDFEKAANPEEYKINHEIIKAMKSAIPDLMPNFDIEKENQKQEMRELSKKIFATNIPFTDEEKNKLMEHLQQKWSQNYFLIYLSKQRTNGRFSRSQKLVKDLAEILNLILKTAEKEKDYHAAKNCMILSQTYYYDEKDKDGNTKKKYLIDYIINYNWLRTPGFWRGIIEEMIVSEAKKYMSANPKEHDLFDKNDKSSREKLSNISFSQILPYVNNMKEFFMDERFIVKIIDEFVENYEIQKELADTIYGGVISDKPEEVEKLRKEYKDNPNFENELMTLDEVRKKRGIS